MDSGGRKRSHSGSEAELYELDLDGEQVDVNTPGPVKWGSNTASNIIVLASNPLDCLLWLVVDDGTTQSIVTVDTSTEPGADGDYDATLVGAVTGNDLVDIAFGMSGGLAGLEEDADWVSINQSNGADIAGCTIRSVGARIPSDTTWRSTRRTPLSSSS